MILLRAYDVLRATPWAVREGRTARRLMHLGVLVVVFGVVYGAVMGSYAGVFGERFLQVVYSAAKVPLLLMLTFALSLPSFFVINTLLGLRSDFAYAVRALVATQAGLTIILASFAPFTVLWYASFGDYRAAILFNAVMFGTASISAQWLLRRFYEPLIQRNKQHRLMLRGWLVIYAFVGIQMGWVLRPFIGNPNSPTQFFREEAWGNAYVRLAQIVINLLGG
jgi:hypothetical protein